MTEATTCTLDAPGATLTYDVRTGGSTGEVPLFLISSPMGAASFGSLAGHLPDRTLITCDPRGSERSMKDDPTAASTPEQHADGRHHAVAKGLGTQLVVFPSGHGGFLGGEYGQSGDRTPSPRSGRTSSTSADRCSSPQRRL